MLKRMMAVTLAIGLCGLVAWSSGPTDTRAHAGAIPFAPEALITEPWAPDEGLTGGGGGGAPDIDMSDLAREAGLGGSESFH